MLLHKRFCCACAVSTMFFSPLPLFLLFHNTGWSPLLITAGNAWWAAARVAGPAGTSCLAAFLWCLGVLRAVAVSKVRFNGDSTAPHQSKDGEGLRFKLHAWNAIDGCAPLTIYSLLCVSAVLPSHSHPRLQCDGSVGPHCWHLSCCPRCLCVCAGAWSEVLPSALATTINLCVEHQAGV